jgi:hypothetical protein
MAHRALGQGWGQLLAVAGVVAALGCTGSEDALFSGGTGNSGGATSTLPTGGHHLGGGGGSATGGAGAGASGGVGGASTTSTTSSTSSSGGSTTTTTSSTSSGGGGAGGAGGAPADPCVSECGATELCDGVHAGLDDDCDGLVDEGCPCSVGMAQSCFKGDPGHRNDPGCFAGTQHCNAQQQWGSCLGGVHATDGCDLPAPGCHAISSYPFVPVDLKAGTGTFSGNALSETWTVTCPAGVTPCPAVAGSNPPDDFQPLQSGQYLVQYTKQTSNGAASCTYPLFVGAPGLRVELDWEHDLGGTGVDLDLHVHQPADTSPWGGNTSTSADCAWDNCAPNAFDPAWPNQYAPDWFSGVAPPDPVDWYLDPVPAHNSCYYAPRGNGARWQGYLKGCHSPRLDLDNITCDPAILDVNNSAFCSPENSNIDFPPKDEWIRIGVHYYAAHGVSYNVHPRIRVFCGSLVAELGPAGYNAPITFTPADGADSSTGRFWLVADVRFLDDPCMPSKCEVRPLYQNPSLLTPVLSTMQAARQTFQPGYPP